MNRRSDDRRDDRRSSRKSEPVHSIRHKTNGGTMEVAIWENEVGEGREKRMVFNVSIKRSWHDGKEWNDTASMRVQDLPALAMLTQEAYQWCQSEMART